MKYVLCLLAIAASGCHCPPRIVVLRVESDTVTPIVSHHTGCLRVER